MSAALQLPLVEASSKVTAASPFIVTEMKMKLTTINMRDGRYNWRKDECNIKDDHLKDKRY